MDRTILLGTPCCQIHPLNNHRLRQVIHMSAMDFVCVQRANLEYGSRYAIHLLERISIFIIG